MTKSLSLLLSLVLVSIAGAAEWKTQGPLSDPPAGTILAQVRASAATEKKVRALVSCSVDCDVALELIDNPGPDERKIRSQVLHLLGRRPYDSVAPFTLPPSSTFALRIRLIKDATGQVQASLFGADGGISSVNTINAETLVLTKAGLPAWGLGVTRTGGFSIEDYAASRSILRADPGLPLYLWIDGALRPLFVGPPGSGGPGLRAVATPN